MWQFIIEELIVKTHTSCSKSNITIFGSVSKYLDVQRIKSSYLFIKKVYDWFYNLKEYQISLAYVYSSSWKISG